MSPLSRITARQKIDPNLPEFESVVHVFRAAVGAAPDTTAVVFKGSEGDRRIDYRAFGRAVNGLAGQLRRLGLEGQRVVLLMPN